MELCCVHAYKYLEDGDVAYSQDARICMDAQPRRNRKTSLAVIGQADATPGAVGTVDDHGLKERFNINAVVKAIRKAVVPFPKAALFELAEEGYKSVFEILAACIISIRTFDEVTIPTAKRLFAVARTPQEMARLNVRDIDRLIGACTFHGPKARTIRAIAQEAIDKYGGNIPCDAETLMSFHGVGPKCAHLVLGIACGEPFISVDIHVHRVTNRWGYVAASTPEKTMEALYKILPKRHWIEINRLLVPFGKHICTGRLPKCSTCPVLSMCRQVGVGAHR
jgi:endonuclease III